MQEHQDETDGKRVTTCDSIRHIKSRYEATPTFTVTQIMFFVSIYHILIAPRRLWVSWQLYTKLYTKLHGKQLLTG